MAGKHHSHAAIINAHIVLLTVKGPRCIFSAIFLYPIAGDGREAGGPPRLCAQLECTNPGEGGWVPGRVLQTTEGLKAVSGENAQGDTEIWSPAVWSASLAQPWTFSWTHLLFPTMKSDLSEQRAQVNGQEQSNCLSLWYATAKQSWRSVQQSIPRACSFKSVFVSVSALGVCWHVHAHVLCGGLQSITMQSLAFLEVDEGNYLRLIWEEAKVVTCGGLFPSFARVCAQLACVPGCQRQWVGWEI